MFYIILIIVALVSVYLGIACGAYLLACNINEFSYINKYWYYVPILYLHGLFFVVFRIDCKIKRKLELLNFEVSIPLILISGEEAMEEQEEKACDQPNEDANNVLECSIFNIANKKVYYNLSRTIQAMPA